MPLPTAAAVQAAAASDSDKNHHADVWTALVTAPAADWEAVRALLSAVPQWTAAAQQALVDVLWLQTSLVEDKDKKMETDTDDAGTTAHKNHTPDYAQLVAVLVQAVPALQPRLLATLQAHWLTEISVPEADWTKRVRQVNTAQFYKQYKYNILAEVSEGYAKWLTYCRQQVHNKDNGIDKIPDTVLECLGTFALDPSRCLDLALDVLEDALTVHPTPSAGLTTILQTLQTDKITAIVAFKLRSHGHKIIPPSCLHTVVYLLAHGWLDWSPLCTYLPEWYDVLQDTAAAYTKRERQRLRNLGKVRLSASSADETLPPVDVQPLAQHVTTQLITAALQDNNENNDSEILLNQLQSLLSQDVWSALCCLFPDAVGGPLLDAVARTIAPQLAPVWPTDHDQVEMKDKAHNIDHHHHRDQESSPDALLARVTTLLSYTHAAGCLAHARPLLLGQLWRWVAAYLDDDVAVDACVRLVQDFLLPALGPGNPALNNLAWQALRLLPCRQRYTMYAAWRGSGWGRQALHSDKALWCIESEIVAEKQVRYDLKRLSKDTVRETSRAIGKVSHSHPLVVFSIMLATMESYDNMIHVMVESMRFVAPLSLDVLCFCILQRLAGTMGGVNRSRLKEDGVNVSQWLQSLETFIGALCRQFPALEVRGIISYLILRLRKGEVMELGVLRAILKISGGWAFADHAQAAALAPVQLEGRAGSTLLKREIMSFGVPEDFSVEASSSIRRMLQSDNFGTTILILLAQVHHQIIFEGQGRPKKPIKLIGNLVDLCQATMAILLDFLADSAVERTVTDGKPPEAILTLANSMPPLLDLIENFELDLSSVWMICRPLVRAAYHGMEHVDANAAVEVAKLANFRIGKTVRQAYQARLPEATWTHISCDLYESFYCNTLFDIFLPDDSYKTEITRLEKEIDSKSKSKMESDANALERMKKSMAELSSDWNKQRHHVESVRTDLKDKAKSFFVSNEVTTKAMTAFFTTCIFPRCMKGPDDALYCVHFIAMLHSFETPGFGTLELYDLIIVSLSRAVFGLTEAEAANVAILLERLWKNVSRWRYDEECFAEEMKGKVGCYVSGEAISEESFPALYNKWHASLGGAMLGCLRSSEYMHWYVKPRKRSIFVLVCPLNQSPCIVEILLSFCLAWWKNIRHGPLWQINCFRRWNPYRKKITPLRTLGRPHRLTVHSLSERVMTAYGKKRPKELKELERQKKRPRQPLVRRKLRNRWKKCSEIRKKSPKRSENGKATTSGVKAAVRLVENAKMIVGDLRRNVKKGAEEKTGGGNLTIDASVPMRHVKGPGAASEVERLRRWITMPAARM